MTQAVILIEQRQAGTGMLRIRGNPPRLEIRARHSEQPQYTRAPLVRISAVYATIQTALVTTMKVAERSLTTISGTPVDSLYGPDQLKNFDPARDLGCPGEFPYTRGIHRDMYRGKLWTMRQFSGFATPEETNRRYHYLLEEGQNGLSVAFDLPTLMGYDADHAMSAGEVGKCGASVCSLEDMEILFRGIPLGDVTVSMTINSPASVLWAMYLAVAGDQGVDWQRLSGTLQNDILKEYIAQK